MKKWLRVHWQEFQIAPLWLRVALLGSASVCAATFIAQAILFPDNPIFFRNGQYVGKYGAIHTRADFELFRTLNLTLLASGLSTFAGLVYATVTLAPENPPEEN